ncbi:hypothetical protein ACRTEV_12815 [Rossellomorea arthrocnemi]
MRTPKNKLLLSMLIIILLVGLFKVSTLYTEHRKAKIEKASEELEYWSSIESIGTLKDKGYETRYLKSYVQEGEPFKVYTLSKKTAGNDPRWLFVISKDDGKFEEVVLKYPLKEQVGDVSLLHEGNHLYVAFELHQLVGKRYEVVLFDEDGNELDRMKNIMANFLKNSPDKNAFIYEDSETLQQRTILQSNSKLILQNKGEEG